MLEDQAEESSGEVIVTETIAGEAVVAAMIAAGPAAIVVTEEEIGQDLVIVEIGDLETDPTLGTGNLPDVTEAPPMTEEDLDLRAGADLANFFWKEDNFVFDN